jgi:hypothetical protein
MVVLSSWQRRLPRLDGGRYLYCSTTYLAVAPRLSKRQPILLDSVSEMYIWFDKVSLVSSYLCAGLPRCPSRERVPVPSAQKTAGRISLRCTGNGKARHTSLM